MTRFLLLVGAYTFKCYIGKKIVREIKTIQQHHTYVPDYSNFTGSNHIQLLQRMQKAHIERGFDDIAQNITIFPDGVIALCRDLNSAPAGIKGNNQNAICIENIGNFDIGNDVMTKIQKETILQVNAILCRKFNLLPSTDSIVYHSWYSLVSGDRTNGSDTKSCPGSSFFGGNTIEDAERNLIPLIKKEMEIF